MQLKAQGERAVTDNFSDATIIRPAECYGHEDDYFNRYACQYIFTVLIFACINYPE